MENHITKIADEHLLSAAVFMSEVENMKLLLNFLSWVELSWAEGANTKKLKK